MALIIDLQGFRGSENEFIPKEIAILEENEVSSAMGDDINNNAATKFIIKAPYDLKELPRDIRRQNLWLSKHFHGISWDRGTTELSNINEYLEEKLKSRVVFCKGKEKFNWIIRSMPERSFFLLDLENYGCPSIKVLRKQYGELTRCDDHKGVCSVENVHLFADFIREKIRKNVK
ncbi:uncharacterized protein LOC129606435 [Condylostylus longicornis]|uniref:uncharacterized protein LOC129606435 n=1 Tax=Condylostylus longicornis TaxID=2530218 RepID=UPI00244E0200|nr:uncharacterized protein LOC129606435 [Condylostylus longicornis]